ncbi:MAG: ABC transporter ATP-binding protein [Burkholderiales bacterium]|nr:ABC transporter ATP-binding protein [Nitrosomonas sp.]MCP5273772.1 ABC transporter ATP-binding protein [Burkholderiales bacterium]
MNTLLEIDNLKTILHTGNNPVRAVDGLSIKINKGETYALLGESGCGKSMTALSIMRLLPDSGEILSGSIKLSGEDILQLPETGMRRIRGKQISMIFQEPMLSLNPVMTIAEQIDEVLKQHFKLDNKSAQNRILELLGQVGIPDAQRRMHEYSFQFSGGMKQRAMIAMALAGQPELLIADEPTTALDVTIQAQVLDLMREIQQKNHMAILLITHDLGVVSEMAQQVAVMYAGEIIEHTSRKLFFAQAAHPYSQQLFASLPGKQKRFQELAVISGTVPPLSRQFTGCRFADRCNYAIERCHHTIPQWHEIADNHRVRCHLYDASAEFAEKKPLPEIIPKATAAAPQSQANGTLLQVNHLKVHFPIRKGFFKRVVGHVMAVDGVSLKITAGKTLALVGESGCGKTTVGKSILQLISPTAGSVRYNGYELVDMQRQQLRQIRSQLQFVFQDPYSSLNPRMRIIDIILEGMNALNVELPSTTKQSTQSNASIQEKAVDTLLEQVGLPGETKWRYPHEFSGGQRQRIAIARALAVNPKLLICDEPTSALDISVQAQILNLLKSLQNNLGLAYLFITHNISVVEYLADEIAVMYLGRIVEYGQIEEVIENPRHPYTEALLSAVPRIDKDAAETVMIQLKGDLPSPAAPPTGCHFHPRCPHAMPVCRQAYPELSTISPTHITHCHLYSQEKHSTHHEH